MKQEDYHGKKLKKEREKLNRLVDEALKNGISFTQDEVLMAQSRKVDKLIARIQKEKRRSGKKP
ncbi:MAG: hypothetical protein MJA82_09770 [Clostridia bacterium]|nr:hypothetical protein [Clostridia bacterium]